MKLKSSLIIIISLVLMLNVIELTASAAEPEFTVTKTEASVSNAPADSDMIVALYSNERLTGTKIYHGSGTISANYAEDMSAELSEADYIRVFLWSMNTLTPLGNFFGDELQDLPDSTHERVLTVYFSNTGNTRALAEKMHSTAGGDIAEIIPVIPYTSADLNYNNSSSRANVELNTDARPAINPMSVNIEQYDVILVGYPIWWGQCPPAVRTFLDSYDLSGKTIMPFCTSGSTGIGGSLAKIRALCPDSTVTAGFRGTSGTTAAQIKTWLDANSPS